MSISNAALPSLRWAVPALMSLLKQVSVLGWKQQRGFLFSSSLPCPEVDNKVTKVTHRLPKEDNKAAAPLPLWSSSGVPVPQVSCWAPMGALWHWADLSPPKTGTDCNERLFQSLVPFVGLRWFWWWYKMTQCKHMQWVGSQHGFTSKRAFSESHPRACLQCSSNCLLLSIGLDLFLYGYLAAHDALILSIPAQRRLHTLLLSLLPRSLAHRAQTLAWSPALLSFATWQLQKWNPAVRNKSLLYLARFLQSSSVCVRMCSGAGWRQTWLAV